MWLGQLEEELTCIGSWHCSTSAGAERWDISPWGLQPPGKFRWWDSIFFFFSSFPPTSRWCGTGCLHTVGFENSSTWSFQWNLFIKVIFPFPYLYDKTPFGRLPHAGCCSEFEFRLLQTVRCPPASLLLLWTSVFPSAKWGGWLKLPSLISEAERLLLIKAFYGEQIPRLQTPGLFSKESSPQ